jgi:hypothetical protein
MIHFLKRTTHFSKTSCSPFPASFRTTVEQAIFKSCSSHFIFSLQHLIRLMVEMQNFLSTSSRTHNSMAQRSPKETYSCCIKKLFSQNDRNSNSNSDYRDEDHATTTLHPPLQLGIRVTASLCITAAHCCQYANFPNGPRMYVNSKYFVPEKSTERRNSAVQIEA